MKKTLGERLKEAREDKGWSKADLRRQAGLKSPSTLTELEKGDRTESPQLPLIAAALGVEVLWLQHEIGPKHRDGLLPSPDRPASLKNAQSLSELETAPDLRGYRRIPLVGEVQGGADGYLMELAYPVGHGDGYVEYPARDSMAYALRVRGDSMHPRYRAGEFVIIEPSIEAQAGDDVVVCCKDGRKMLKMLNWIRDGEAQFLSINNGYAPLTIQLQDIESIQVASGRAPRSALIKV